MNGPQEEGVTRCGKSDPLLSTETTFDRFPAIHAVFEQIAVEFSRCLEGISTTPASFFVESIGAEKIEALNCEFERYEISGIFHVSQLETRAAIGVSRGFVFGLLEIMLGSGGGDPQYSVDRPLSNIERRIAEFAIERLAAATKTAFSPFVKIEFHLEKFEDVIDLAALGRRGNIGIFCAFAMRLRNHDFRATIAFPRASLEPFRSALSEGHVTEASSQDHRWTHKMRHHIAKTPVTICAIMEKPNVNLVDIASLDIGSIIELPFAPTDRLKLVCQGTTLFWCALGQKDGRYTVRIEGFVGEARSDVVGPS
jgi:flagellar motor switch protein FliM